MVKFFFSFFGVDDKLGILSPKEKWKAHSNPQDQVGYRRAQAVGLHRLLIKVKGFRSWLQQLGYSTVNCRLYFHIWDGYFTL